VIHVNYSNEFDAFLLATSSEYYHNSVMFSAGLDAGTADFDP
jgi:hypothetical protein